MKKRTKKYFVSLACYEPANWEMTVEAKNQREAIAKARDAFHDGSSEGEFVDVYEQGAILMKGNKGVHVEEVGDDSD
ncbi:MAG: hypothetical protein JOZ43_02255 [Acidobacteriales bacterium]|nr:hypothetical protein [Terriglobales bacterium]